MTSRYQQKMYKKIFKSGHALEQSSKIKSRVRQSVKWLEHIPCLKPKLVATSSLNTTSRKTSGMHLLISLGNRFFQNDKSNFQFLQQVNHNLDCLLNIPI